jgi:hypothetical protein
MPTPHHDDDEIAITNEFTSVRIRKTHTRNGERLTVSSPNLGYEIHLDALELESLTWQTPDTFSRLLENPYGPEDDAHDLRSMSELLRPPQSSPDGTNR